jgi:hypothetical protein
LELNRHRVIGNTQVVVSQPAINSFCKRVGSNPMLSCSLWKKRDNILARKDPAQPSFSIVLSPSFPTLHPLSKCSRTVLLLSLFLFLKQICVSTRCIRSRVVSNPCAAHLPGCSTSCCSASPEAWGLHSCESRSHRQELALAGVAGRAGRAVSMTGHALGGGTS